MTLSSWETVIGLEIHVQLNTHSKIFSSAPNRFGDEPNTNISIVCTGQPGALPVLNREAVRKAVQFGCAVRARIAHRCTFDRKSYFYPDSPRNFQITQFYEPIVIGGQLVAEVEGVPHTFTIHHAHLEDDAGMLKHFSSFAGVDYNRAGAPLLEIVSDPCIHSPQEAVAYAKGIKAIMEYIDASDCNMEEGSLRVDANISVRLRGEKRLRNKIEIKNMNSFSNLEEALTSEIRRQIREYERHSERDVDQVIEQATYRWDPDRRETVLMRRKEHADDYRYFPEPDLPPVVLTQSLIDEIRTSLPELPYERLKRYETDYQLSSYTAGILTAEKWLADYFESALVNCPHPKQVANWITVEFFGRLKDSGKTLKEIGILPDHIGQLVDLIRNQTITGKIAKAVADEMIVHPGRSPEEIIASNPNFLPVQNVDEIRTIIENVIIEHAQSVSDFQAGKARAFGFLVGQVMKATGGKAPPDIVNQLLKEKLSSQS